MSAPLTPPGAAESDRGAGCRPRPFPVRPVQLLPLEPIYTAVGSDQAVDLAGAVGVSRRTVHRWRSRGGVSRLQADRIAVALERHVSELWPEAA